jgi:poly-gamma-glutamate synthesis protein (capsule biosynthesis protein)
VAFVGFSDIGPYEFAAGAGKPGTRLASVENIRADVAAARKVGDVVVATFHWGIERDTRPSARQIAFGRAALAAGATAVIGAHPHVLQPIVRPSPRRVVAYSLGNFVWSAGSAASSRTGLLTVRLSARGVEGVALRSARIVDTRPRPR